MMINRILLFTKSWPDKSLEKLASFTAGLGFDGVELPVRNGYQVHPGNARKMLPVTADIFHRHGLEIGSIAGFLEAGIIRGMGDAGIPLLRIMPDIDMKKGYFRSVEQWRMRIVEFRPLLEECRVRVGVQNHYGYFTGSALGLHHLLTGIPDSVAGAVLDPAHCELAGEPADMALDIVRDRLLMINFKNAYRHRMTGPDEDVRWQILWTTAERGFISWKNVADDLSALKSGVDICCHAEYSQAGMNGQLYGDDVVPLIQSDLSFLKKVLGQGTAAVELQN